MVLAQNMNHFVSMGTRVESPSFSKLGARLPAHEQRVHCVTQASTGLLIVDETLLYANQRNSSFRTPSAHPQSQSYRQTQPNKIA